MQGDVGKKQDVQALFSACDDELRRVTCLVSNAGIIGKTGKIDGSLPGAGSRLQDQRLRRHVLYSGGRETLIHHQYGRGKSAAPQAPAYLRSFSPEPCDDNVSAHSFQLNCHAAPVKHSVGCLIPVQYKHQCLERFAVA
ncbi:hypothetical protein [Neorhizobium petrolearium]|uniref:hypothetical protein n=1 Tax=Neorhizobium petrolearium TaxID=515361 RepID=UPI003F5CE64E